MSPPFQAQAARAHGGQRHAEIKRPHGPGPMRATGHVRRARRQDSRPNSSRREGPLLGSRSSPAATMAGNKGTKEKRASPMPDSVADAPASAGRRKEPRRVPWAGRGTSSPSAADVRGRLYHAGAGSGEAGAARPVTGSGCCRRPRRRGRHAAAADQHVVAGAAVRVSSPAPPIRTSSPSPPFAGQLDRAGRQARGSTTSSPARPLIVEPVVAGLGAGDVHRAARPGDGDPAAASPVDDDASSPSVPLTMTVSASSSPAPPSAARLTLTSATSVPLRSLTVIVSAPPRAFSVDPLDVVEVHDDVADVAGEADARRRWPRPRRSRRRRSR